MLSSAFSLRGGEWGLVAPAVFKTVVSARKRRKVGSIPTRLRQPLPHARPDEKSVDVEAWVASGGAGVRDVKEAVAGVQRHPRVRKNHDAQPELRVEVAFRRRR